MAKLTPAHQDVIRMARSLIRDSAMNWARDELAADPEAVCEQLSGMIGEEYDFEKGEVILQQAKINIFADTVLRRNLSNELFLMNHQETGWSSSAVPMRSVEHLLERYNVRIGDWTTDKFSEYCPVYRVRHEP